MAHSLCGNDCTPAAPGVASAAMKGILVTLLLLALSLVVIELLSSILIQAGSR